MAIYMEGEIQLADHGRLIKTLANNCLSCLDIY